MILMILLFFPEISQVMFVPICTRMMMEIGLVSFADTILSTPREWRSILKLSIISPDYSISVKSVANSVKLKMH